MNSWDLLYSCSLSDVVACVHRLPNPLQAHRTTLAWHASSGPSDPKSVCLLQAPPELLPPQAAAAGGVRALGWALAAVSAPPRGLFADIGGVPAAPGDAAAREGARAWRTAAAAALRRLPPLLAALGAAGALDASAAAESASKPSALAVPASPYPAETLPSRRGAPLRPGVLIEELPDAGAAELEAPPAADPIHVTLAAALFLGRGRGLLDAPWADAATGDAARALLSCLASASGHTHGKTSGSAVRSSGPASRTEPGPAGQEQGPPQLQDAAAGVGSGTGSPAASNGVEGKAAAGVSIEQRAAALPSSSCAHAKAPGALGILAVVPDSAAEKDLDRKLAGPGCAQAEALGAPGTLVGVAGGAAQQLVAALLRPAAVRLHRVLAPAPGGTREGARVAPERGAQCPNSHKSVQVVPQSCWVQVKGAGMCCDVECCAGTQWCRLGTLQAGARHI